MRTVTLLGVPSDSGSSFLDGCRLGPAAIREAFRSPAGTTFAEDGTDPGSHPGFLDAGDVALDGDDRGRSAIERRAAEILESGSALLALGGDHAVTHPLLRAHAARLGPVDVLQLDAHPDLYDELAGDRHSHACPFARAHEEGLIARHVQVGIRAATRHQLEQADRFGVEVVPMRDARSHRPRLERPVYVTLDLDVLDPAFAPGVSHHEPGGMSVRELLDVLQELPAGILGADLVELNPTRDRDGVTATVAAKLVRELASAMLGV